MFNRANSPLEFAQRPTGADVHSTTGNLPACLVEEYANGLAFVEPADKFLSGFSFDRCFFAIIDIALLTMPPMMVIMEPAKVVIPARRSREPFRASIYPLLHIGQGNHWRGNHWRGKQLARLSIGKAKTT